MSAAEIAARRDGFKAVSLNFEKKRLEWRLEKYPVVDRITSALERRSNLNCAIDLINKHDLYGCFDQRELMQILIAVEQLPRDPSEEQSIKEQFEKIMNPFEEAIELLRQEKKELDAQLEQARKSRIEAEARLKAVIKSRAEEAEARQEAEKRRIEEKERRVEAEKRRMEEKERRVEAEKREAEKNEELIKIRSQYERLVNENRKTKASFFSDSERPQAHGVKRAKLTEEGPQSDEDIGVEDKRVSKNV
jgi:hypothetical protein